VFVAPAFYWQL